MRELKFRAWDTCRKGWYVPWHRSKLYMTMWGDPFYLHPNDGSIVYHGDIVLMQYTGLKDKNGKKIYEGDVLLIPDEYTDRILDDGTGPREPFNHLSVVCFDSLGGFGVEILEHGDIFDVRFWSFERIVAETGEAKFEVVGNVYDNPEVKS